MGISDEDLLLSYAGHADSLSWARAKLDEFGDSFRYQLIIAMHLRHQVAHLDELRAERQLRTSGERKYVQGYRNALRDIAERLEDGDYLPGGSAHDDTVAGDAS